MNQGINFIFLLTCVITTFLFPSKILGQRQNPGEKIEMITVSLRLIPENKDTANYYLPFIARTFLGKVTKHENDTIIFTITRDSLGRSFYFLDKLGKVRRKRTRKVDISETYHELHTRLDSLQGVYDKHEEELAAARFHKEALEAEKKLLKIQEVLKPVKKDFNRLKYLAKHPIFVVHIKEKGAGKRN